MDLKNMARGVMDAASGSGATMKVKFDIGRWRPEDVQGLMAVFASEAKGYKLRVKGVTTDTAGAQKLGLEMDRSNSARHEGVQVVVAAVDFDSFELVLEQI